MMGKTTCSDSFHWKKWTCLQHLEKLQHQKCCTIWPSGSRLLPWPKKRTIIEIRGEKNAVPRVISCSIRRDQRRASPIRDCPRLLPCADRAWSSMISHVEQRSSRHESRGWFFFLARVLDRQKHACSFCAVSEPCRSTEMSLWLAGIISVDFDSEVTLRTQVPVFHSKLRIFRVSADNVSNSARFPN